MQNTVFKAFCDEKILKSNLTKILEGKFDFTIKSAYNDNLVTVNFGQAELSVVREYEQKIYSTLNKYIYFDGDISLPEMCSLLLRTYKKKVGVAESLTGGMIADSFVSLSGASEVFSEGLVCYSREAKIKNLGVSPRTIMRYTVVSREVAYEMARGIITKDYNDFAISTTGYAEQFGEKDNAGLVYIGIGDKTRVEVYGYKFIGDREKVRKLTTNAAIFHLIKKIKGSFDYVG